MEYADYSIAVGLAQGIFFIFISLFICCFILIKSRIHFISMFPYLTLSAISRFGAGLVYYFYSAHYGSDAHGYFHQSMISSFGFTSNHLVYCIVWIVRALFTHNSLLGTFYFFSCLGLITSVCYYYLFYSVCIDKLNIHASDVRKMLLPKLLFFLWPSFLFWTSAIGKDSLMSFFIASSLALIFKERKSLLSNCCSLFFLAMLCLIRPYMFLIIGTATIILFVINGSRISFFKKLLIITALICIFAYSVAFFKQWGKLASFSIADLAARAGSQQTILSSGTHIIVPNIAGTLNPFVMLPYTFFCNFLMPLFYPLNGGVMAIFSSIQNSILLIFSTQFISRWSLWKLLSQHGIVFNYVFYYFLFGISFFGLINTNLGLASREKMMFIPAFFLLICWHKILYRHQSSAHHSGYATKKYDTFAPNR